MDPNYVYDNLISQDYDNVVNHVYNDLSNIIIHLDHGYINRVVHGDIFTMITYLKTAPKYDNTWLRIVRELILYLCHKYAEITIENANIIKADTDTKIKLLIMYAIYYHYGYYDKKLYAGMDFEFNDRKIALCQVAFFPKQKYRYIWIYDPTWLDTKQTNYIIRYLFTSEHIYKIVHRSDSLDIPYLFNDLFMNNHEQIYAFTTHVIDTRFLCEYHKATINSDKICSIYDAMLFFGTISKKQYDILESIDKKSKNGEPIQKFDINNLSDVNLLYALYDVFYLRKFYFDILKKAKFDTPELFNSYYYIPIITRFIFLEKWGVSDLLARIKNKVDPINNFIIKSKNKNNTLIDIFNNINTNIKIRTKKLNLNVDDLLNINYFRSSIILLLKYITYSILTNYYEIYKNKDEIYEEKIIMADIFNTLKYIHLEQLRTLIKRFYLEIDKRIMIYLPE